MFVIFVVFIVLFINRRAISPCDEYSRQHSLLSEPVRGSGAVLRVHAVRYAAGH